MSLKHLGLGILLAATTGLTAVAQDDAGAPAPGADPKAQMKELQKKVRSAGGKMGRMKRTLMKDNAEAQAIVKEMKELDQKKRELDAKLNETLAAANAEYKTLLDEVKAIQTQIAELKQAEADKRKKAKAPKKKAPKNKKKKKAKAEDAPAIE